ncbi:phenylacetate--CoA ligase family protein [Lysinibacillus endophyticus]|uniref:phenylacetate--CoA ligase family protein n=1 Tax=Ureibacillus endophyticus TaxID=1978490 RepID=UPI0020A0486C|nr:AMP-binding protein [Lysinibacillus endophyticus]MCP1146243.1 AMP-binding protein [Lysinibacillus endophyticus]
MYSPEIETLSREKMQELQLSRLKGTVERVYNNVPFYKQKLDELGIKPSDIKTIEDVRKLPFTVKKDLRDQYPFGLFAVPQKDIVRIHGSSGTSGKPTVVGYTKNDIENWSDLIARAVVTAGGSPEDIFHNAYGYGLFTGGIGFHHGVEKLGAAVVPISGGNTDRQVTLINDFKPRGIGGTPSYILNIAEKLEELGIAPEDNGLEYGIFGAEPWSEEMRKNIEKKLGIKAMDVYGLSEVMGPGVGIECYEAQDGLHLAEDHFIFEVINPDTLQPVADGEDGELVITCITKEALPLLRYRTGDITSITREKCKCGRTTARMARVKGRTDDMIIIRGVNVFPSEIERELLKVNEFAPYYQIHLWKKGNMDALEVRVELTPSIYQSIEGNLESDAVKKLKKQVQHDLKNACLVSVEVTIQQPLSVPRSEGKAVRVVDHRKELVEEAVR